MRFGDGPSQAATGRVRLQVEVSLGVEADTRLIVLEGGGVRALYT